MPKRLAPLAALVAALAFVAAGPSVARAATPCWQKVIRDYTDADGKITGHYSRPCLRKALKNTPEDLRAYTGIVDAISALLYDAGKNGGGTGGGTSGSTGDQTMSPVQTAAQKRAEEKEKQRKANAAVAKAGTKGSVPDQSRSLPLPLILLGAIGLAAALAAASPPLIRRFRGRFPRLRPAPGSVRPPS